MSSNDKPRCAGTVWDGMHSFPCYYTGKHEHDGKMWCGTHHPPTIKAKQTARDEEYRKREMLRSARRKEMEAVERRRTIEGLTDAELAAECSRRGWEVNR